MGKNKYFTVKMGLKNCKWLFSKFLLQHTTNRYVVIEFTFISIIYFR